MRIVVNIRIPSRNLYSAVRDGSIFNRLGKILDDLRPDEEYFTEQRGEESIMVLNIEDSADVPRETERFFLTFNADAEVRAPMAPPGFRNGGPE